MNALVELVAWNSVVVMLLAIGVAAVTRFVRQPAVAYWLWLVVLLKLVTPPVVRIALPAWAPASPTAPMGITPWQGPSSSHGEAVRGEDDAERARPAPEPTHQPKTSTAAPTPRSAPLRHFAPQISKPRSSWSLPAGAILMALWLTGSTAWFLLAGYRMMRFGRWLRRAAPAPDNLQQTAHAIARRFGIERTPHVLLTGACVPPLLWVGRRRLLVLLPTPLLAGLEPAQQAALVAHELAHHRRRDHWMRWLETAVLGLFWWHPVAWWARRRLQQAEEQCCDAWVLWAFPEAARGYADTLLQTVDFLAAQRSALPLGASGFGKVRQLERRLTMILQGRLSRTLTWRLRLGLLATACCLLPLGARLAAAPSASSRAAHNSVAGTAKPNRAESADAQEKVEILGTVLDADGKPAAGARVWAAARRVHPALRHFTAADDQGRFRFELQPFDAPKQWTVRARLGAQGGEANDASGTVRIAKDQPPEAVTIRMTHRAIVRGRVSEADSGKPIAGVRLFLDTGNIVTTDDQGRYEVGGLKQGEHHIVLVSPARERKPVLFDNLLRPEAQLDIRLPRAGKVVGRVIDENGNPIPGAYVSRSGSGNVLASNGMEESCDAQGRFVWDGVAFNQVTFGILASAPGYDAQIELHVVVREREDPPNITLRLERTKPAQDAGFGAAWIDPADKPVPGAIRGTVQDAHGKPIRDFRIRLQAPRDRRAGDKYVDIDTAHARTGVSFSSDDGTFALGVAGVGGFVRVVAEAPGYGRAVVDRVAIRTVEEIAQVEGVTLQLTAAHALRVRVFEGTQQPPRPAVGAVVTLVDGDPRLDREFDWGFDDFGGLVARTDKDGWANFAHLSFGEATILVEHPGFARRRLGWCNGDEATQVALSPEAVLVGTVQRAGEQPAAVYYGRLESLGGDRLSFTVPADGQGRFRVDQLPGGTYELTLFDEQSQKIAKRALILQAGWEGKITIDVPGGAAGRALQGEADEPVTEAIRRGVEYLKNQQHTDGSWDELEFYSGGITALCTLALLEAGVAPDEEHVRKALEYLRTLEPDKTYAVAVQTLVFCAAGSNQDLLRIRRNVQWLEETQIKEPGPTLGGWAYDARGTGDGDASNSHFAMLALAAAAQRGQRVAEDTWKRADSFWRTQQGQDGSWGYRGTAGTGSMTCAGITALVIIRRELNEQAEQPDKALERAVAWLGKHFSATVNPNTQPGYWYGYYLAALGRAGRLADIDRFANHDWRAEGVEALLKSQDPLQGAWTGFGGFEWTRTVSTSFALMFLAAAQHER